MSDMNDMPDVTTMTTAEIDAELQRCGLLPEPELDRMVALVSAAFRLKAKLEATEYVVTRLEARLAAAEKVIGAARDVVGYSTFNSGGGLVAILLERLTAYDAAKAKENA